MGVELVGRFSALRDGRALFSGGLRNIFALADLKLNRLLDTFDEWARRGEPATRATSTSRNASSRRGRPSRHVCSIDLGSGEIRTIVWATGFRPDYSWLHVPVLDQKGHLRHDGGVVDSPGMVVLGLPVLRRRKSSFIHGAEDDARELVAHIAGYLGLPARPRSDRLASAAGAGQFGRRPDFG